MNEPQTIVFKLLIVVIFMIPFSVLAKLLLQCRDDALKAWAARHGYKLLAAEPRLFWRGPFSLKTNRGQHVFRIVIQQDNESSRAGWIRIGNRWSGLLSDEVSLVWDDEATP